MRSFLKEWWILLLIAGVLSFFTAWVFVDWFILTKTPLFRLQTTGCIEGYEYGVVWAKDKHINMNIAIPLWDKDGKPRPCSKEKP